MLYELPEIRIVHGDCVTELFVGDDQMIAQFMKPEITAAEALVACGYRVKEEWIQYNEDDTEDTQEMEAVQ